MLNEEVLKLKAVMLIDEDGKQLGTMLSKDAFEIAKQKELDILCVNPKLATPVCKLLNYGKYKFNQEKKEKEARKNSAKVEVKNVQISMQIAEHDMETKAKQTRKFIDKGDSVKISMRLRGREVTVKDRAFEKLHLFLSMIGKYSVKKQESFLGKELFIIIEKEK